MNLTENQKDILSTRIMLEKLAVDGSVMDFFHAGKAAAFAEIAGDDEMAAAYRDMAKRWAAADFGWKESNSDE